MGCSTCEAARRWLPKAVAERLRLLEARREVERAERRIAKRAAKAGVAVPRGT